MYRIGGSVFQRMMRPLRVVNIHCFTHHFPRLRRRGLSKVGNTSASWTFSNDTSAATISWVTGSTARCNLRHTRRFSAPCFLTFHSPSPNTFSPVESITRSVIRPLGGLSIGHSHRAGPLAYAAIVRRTQRYVHQLEQGVE